MMMKKVLLALGFAAVASSAQAYSIDVVAGGTTPLIGSNAINFDGILPPAELVSGGAIFNTSITNVTAKPVGSVDNFYSVGASPGQEGPGIFNLGGDVNYFGFLWGSVDTHNVVTLLNNGLTVFSFSGNGFVPSNGDQSQSIYVNIFGGDGEFFDEIQFATGSIAFEIDNAGYSTVPVPAALPLMASALGLFGLSRRKNKAKVA